jgi:hypothetical protein
MPGNTILSPSADALALEASSASAFVMLLSRLPSAENGQVYMNLEPEIRFERKLIIAAFFCTWAFI